MSKAKISDLKPDPKNANRGTIRGRKALDESLRQYGAGRSILVDKHGQVIAGNKTLEVAADIGLEDVIMVQTDGHQLVAVQRTDLDLADNDARMLAYYDNRTGQLGLEWDAEQLQADMLAGVKLDGLFNDNELVNLGVSVDGLLDADPNALWKGMPEFEQEDLGAVKSIKVNFATLDDMAAFAELVGQKLTEKTRSIWYPKADKLSQTDKIYHE